MSEKPPEVKDAQVRGDTDALRAMGRKGGKKSAERADALRAIREEDREKELRGEHDQFTAANYHILTPDGITIDDDTSGEWDGEAMQGALDRMRKKLRTLEEGK